MQTPKRNSWFPAVTLSLLLVLLAGCKASVGADRATPRQVYDQVEANVRGLIFLQPLPFVGRVIFISTPHRGSYMAGEFVRNLVRKFVALPEALLNKSTEFMIQSKDVKLPASFRGEMPTSVDGMSAKNPMLLQLAELPVAPPIKAHSIIAIKGDDEPPAGSDGVVKYSSAHVDSVESELVVRSGHSCQDQPAAIEEVRRILHEHLKALAVAGTPPRSQP
jgi:hypothetical protein